MIIKRSIFPLIREAVYGEKRVILLYGPRQAGKTTLLNSLAEEIPAGEQVFLTGDDLQVQEIFSRPILDNLKKVVGGKKYLFLDEAQRIENIGLTLKLLTDNLPLQILASGSSSLDLAGKVSEPLTGRTKTYFLYPLAWEEAPFSPLANINDKIEQCLCFGAYPKAMTLESEKEKENYLTELINNYLYKDILTFENVRKPKKVVDLLSLLALQIGSEVSIFELSQSLSLSKIIVEKYLDLLEKMYVIYNLRGFSRNLRKEITKTSKYYFYDLGLRNALIRNFNPLNLRQDTGALFENFAIVERMKSLSFRQEFANFYFWRTYDQKEIDLIEEKKGKLNCFEFKYKTKKEKSPAFKLFAKTYPQSRQKNVSIENFEKFLSE